MATVAGSGVKRLIRALRPHRLIALDTMVFIYHLMDHPRYAPLSSAVLEQVESGALLAVASTLTLAELLTRAAQCGDAQAARDYEGLLTQFPHLSLAPMDVGVARQAALLRGASNVPMADAIHVATAQQAGAGAMVTNDYAWRAWVARPKLVLLGDYA
jgi:predicted nucleic acid-binding protein